MPIITISAVQTIRLPESKPAAVIEGQPLHVDVDKGITTEALQARLIELQERAPIVALRTLHHCGLSSLPDVSFLRNLHTLEVPDPSVRKLPQRFPTSLRELHLAHLTDASWATHSTRRVSPARFAH